MDVIVSPSSDRPIYAQIAEQIAAQILNGTLPAGSALPPIRTVARQLEVSVITVKKAWEQLERDGLIHAIIGKGSFVAPQHASSLANKRDEIALTRLRKDLVFYKGLGLTQDELIELIRRTYG